MQSRACRSARLVVIYVRIIGEGKPDQRRAARCVALTAGPAGDRDTAKWRFTLRGLLGLILSIGVAMRGVEESAEEAVAAADRCLYEAKNAGRNRVIARTVASEAS